MAVMLIRRMDSLVMPGSRPLGPTDRVSALTPIDLPHRFMTACAIQRSRAPLSATIVNHGFSGRMPPARRGPLFATAVRSGEVPSDSGWSSLQPLLQG